MNLYNQYSFKHSPDYALYKYLLLAFYVASLSEGILRKWIAPGLATPIFFLKYVFSLTVLLLLILNKNKISLQLFPFTGILFLLIFYCMVGLINYEYSRNFMVGFMGMIIHFGFLPVMLSLPIVINKKNQLQNIFHIINFIALGVFILGIIQYFSPSDSFINKYVGDDTYVVEVMGHARITTIFSYISTYTSFLNFILVLLFIQLLNLSGINFRNLVLVGAFFLGLINVFMTGSRGAVGTFFIMAFIIFFIRMLSIGGFRIIIYVFNSILVVVLSFFILSNTEAGRASVESFLYRVETSDSVGGRVADALNPFKFIDLAGLIGYGIGTTYQGAQQFIQGSGYMPYYEEESERLLLEVGLIGLLLIWIFRLSIFFFAIKTYKNTSDSLLKLLSLAIIVHQLPAIFIFNMLVFNWMENIFYWTEAGMLACITIMNQYERSKNYSIAS